ncbi:MAG: hypothetical protein AVDCRST_MAG47-2595, partial [uncultured Nocardioidaceae bacterium]
DRALATTATQAEAAAAPRRAVRCGVAVLRVRAVHAPVQHPQRDRIRGGAAGLRRGGAGHAGHRRRAAFLRRDPTLGCGDPPRLLRDAHHRRRGVRRRPRRRAGRLQRRM